ncbi:MAG: trypsin-like serine protease [Bdellovibrionota bacterium]
MSKNALYFLAAVMLFVSTDSVIVLAKTPGIPTCIPMIGGSSSLLPKMLAQLAPTHIFLPDSRKDVSFENAQKFYPYSRMGLVVAKDPVWGFQMHSCSGVLVGENLVLTNLHCLNGLKDLVFTFKAGHTEGKSIAESNAIQVHYKRVPTTKDDGNIEFFQSQDFAVLVLEEPIGKNWAT